jgi:lipopolysaccharide/colanic/teichoic acid biosynthesis glycosyltransferase
VASIPILREGARARPAALSGGEYSERLAAAVLLLAAAPVLGLSAFTLAVLSRRSPLIAHRRVGWRGSTLWMLKLRTMWDGQDAGHRGWIERIEDAAGPQQKTDRDPRVRHAFARFCRRHSLDELPQLLHVIRGEMALVGPRPLTAEELSRHYGEDAVEILQAKPGIAGLWQVSGRNRLTYAERKEFDLQLVRHGSARLYLRILLRTVAEVWSGANSW